MKVEKMIMECNKHNNLIKTDFSFQNKYIQFFAMELIQGTDLASLLK